MGVLNVTPDSFSDGGRFATADAAVAQAEAMVDAGADLIDVGGESTRPGSVPVAADEQIQRVVPVIRVSRICRSRSRSIHPQRRRRRRARRGRRVVNDISAGAR
jgi:dihydropteroate synthase